MLRRMRPVVSTARTDVSGDTLKEGAQKLGPARKLRDDSGTGDEPLMDKINLDLFLVAHLGGHSVP